MSWHWYVLAVLAVVELAGIAAALALCNAAAQRPAFGPPQPLHRRKTDRPNEEQA